MDITRKLYRRPLVLLCILIIPAIIIVATLLSYLAESTRPNLVVVNKGPLDIRLVGVCPDGGEQIYDASGRKLKITMGALGGVLSNYWKDEDQRRDFLFKVPDVNSQVVFLPFFHMYIAGTKHGLGGGRGGYFDPTDSPFNFIYSTTFDRTYQKNLLFFKFNEAIRNIDLTFRYLYGPRGQATCTFTGPFTMNQTVEADGAKPYYLTFQEAITFDDSGVHLLFKTSETFDRETLAILYDPNGRRYMLDVYDGSSGSNRIELKYHGVLVSPENIAAVTFGEKPYEITFKNVAVDYPERPYRSYPAFLDEIAQRLGLTGMSPEGLARYNFRSPGEAVKVIDIVRGEHIRLACYAIQYGKPKIDISKLDQPTQDKIRRAATEWAKADYMAGYGVSLGLMGRWPEFFDMAIERLGREIPHGDGSPYYERSRRQNLSPITIAVSNYRTDQLTVEQVQKIREIILKTDSSSVLNCLFICLERMKSQATTDVLWELAQNEKPWIWWHATEAWYSRTSRTRQVYNDLSEKMRLRLLLVSDTIKDETLEEKALKMLPEIFTPELGKMASDVLNKVRERISLEFDRKAATEIFINYLRQLQSEMTVRQWTSNDVFKNNSKSKAAYIIRTLNVWYGTNIGKLGTDETRDTDIYTLIRTQIEFQSLLSEAIQWYDSNRDASPIELTFTGKVVDPAGKPIAGAELSFTKRQSYETENGIRRQRSTHAGSCSADANGCFEFGDFENGWFYLFSVTADGFLPKSELYVQCLIDGRYRYHEQNAPQDNVIVLRRP